MSAAASKICQDSLPNHTVPHKLRKQFALSDAMALVFHILHDAEKVASVVASWNPLINLIMLRLLDLKSSDETICRMDCCTIKRYISFSPLLLTTQPAQQLNDGKANAAASKARPVPLPRSRKLSPIQTWILACQICIDLPEIHS